MSASSVAYEYCQRLIHRVSESRKTFLTKASKRRKAHRPTGAATCEALENRILLSGSPLTDAYVNDDWAGLTIGVDPDADGPATELGVDAFASIQDAIDAIGDDGTVHIHAGTYAEALAYTKPITLSGISGDAADVVINASGENRGIKITLSDGDQTISNLTVINAQREGIYLTSAIDNDFNLNNVVITNSGYDGIRAIGVYPIGSDVKPSNVILNDVNSSHNGSSGISLEYCSSLADTNGIYDQNGKDGIFIETIYGDVNLTRTNLTHNDTGLNTYYTPLGYAIRGDLTLNGVNASSNSNGIYINSGVAGDVFIQDHDNGIDIEQTSMNGNGEQAIYLETVGGSVTIEEGDYSFNGTINNDQAAIDIRQVLNSMTINNIQSIYNDGDALLLEGVDATITNSTLSNNGRYGLILGQLITTGNITTQATLIGNTITQNQWGGLYLNQATALIQENDFSNNAGYGIFLSRESVVDAGDFNDTNITGLGSGSLTNGSSAGQNIFLGYTGGDTSAAINNRNFASSHLDVLAQMNQFGTTDEQTIENIVTHDVDYSHLSHVDFSYPLPLTPVPDIFVNIAWASLENGVDPDGDGPATSMGVDAFYGINFAIDAVADGDTIFVYDGTYHQTVNSSARYTKPFTLVGSFTLEGNLHLDSPPEYSTGVTLAVELNGNTPGADYNQINVSQSVSLSNVNLDLTLNFLPQLGDRFTLINLGRTTGYVAEGEFNGLPEGTIIPVTNTVSGQVVMMQISYVGGDGNDIVLTVVEDPTASSLTHTTLQATEDGPGVSSAFLPVDNNGLMTYEIVDQPIHGTVTNNQDGTFTYTPGDFPDLNAGEQTTVLFSYRGIDSSNNPTDLSTVSVSINGVNETPDSSNGYPTAAVDNAYTDSDQPTEINVLPNDADPDGDTVHVTSVDAVSHLGVPLTINSDGSIHYDPIGYFDSYTVGDQILDYFRYEVQDPYGQGDQTRVNVWVDVVESQAPNHAPTVSSFIGPNATEDGSPVTITFRGDDVDADDSRQTLTYTILSTPEYGTVTNNHDGTFTYEAGDWPYLEFGEDSGWVTITYIATDSHGASSEYPATISFIVYGTSDSPTVYSINKQLSEDADPATYDFNGTDPNGDDITYTIVSQPSGGRVVNNDDGTFTFDPGDDFQDLTFGESRNVTFTYQATNTLGLTSNVGSINIKVTGLNDAPIVYDVSVLTDENNPVTSNFNAVDPNGEAITYYEILTFPPKGILAKNVDGTFTFNPNGEFSDLNTGDMVEYNLTYRATNESGMVATGNLKVRIAGVGNAPESRDVFGYANEGGEPITLSFDALDADADDVLTYTITSSPTEGSVINNNDGTFTFDPGSDFQDLDDQEQRTVFFSYITTDEQGNESDPGWVWITVTGVGSNPTVQNVSQSIFADAAPITIAFNGSDPNGSALTYQLLSTPTQGSLINNHDGTFTFDPSPNDVNPFDDLAPGESRAISVQYVATNQNNEQSAPATLFLTVLGVNDDPVAGDIQQTTDEATPITGNFLGSDVDTSDLLTYAITSQPAYGSVVNNNDGTFTFNPGEDFLDLDKGQSREVTFTYQAIDNHNGQSESATVTMTVNGIDSLVVYVDDDWATLDPSVDPDADGPAKAMGVDAFASLSEALNAVSQGGTIYIADGYYDENSMVLDQSVTLVGNDSQTVIVDLDGNVGFTATADDIAISGLTLQNGTTAILVDNADNTISNLSLDDVSLINNTVAGVEVAADTTLENLNVTDSTFNGNYLSDGIRFNPTGNGNGLVIDNTTFENLSGGIIQKNTSSDGYLTNLEVTSSTFTNNGYAGIYAHELSHVLLDNNTFTENGQGFSFFRNKASILESIEVGNFTITNNTFTDHSSAAVNIQGYSQIHLPILIQGNTFNQNVSTFFGSDSAIQIRLNDYSDSGQVDILENTITYTGEHDIQSTVHGIVLRGALQDVNIQRNTIDGGNIGTINEALTSSGILILILSNNDIAQNDNSQFRADDIYIANNFINNFDAALSLYDQINDVYGGVNAKSSVVLYNNDLSGNVTGILSGDGSAVDASSNWWGSTDVTTVTNMMTGSVDFSPFLESGNDTSADIGFQGDFSSITVHTQGSQQQKLLQEAVEVAQEGADIHVDAGKYTTDYSDVVYGEDVPPRTVEVDSLIINKKVQLFGANAGIDPNTQTRGEESIITGSVIFAASNVVFDGFEVTGEATTEYIYSYSPWVHSLTGKLINLGNGTQYRNLNIHDTPGGIAFVSGNNVTISNSYMDSGIGFYKDSDKTTSVSWSATIDNNVFDHSSIWTSGQYSMYYSLGLSVTGNVFNHGGIGVESMSGLIDGNTFDHSSITMSGSATISNNTFTNESYIVLGHDDPFWRVAGASANITGNVFEFNTDPNQNGGFITLNREATASNIHINGNSFINGHASEDVNLIYNQSAYSYNGQNILDLSTNWFSTTDINKILELTYNPIAGEISYPGLVDISTFLASGTDTDPNTPGFQADLSHLYVHDQGAQTDGLIAEALSLVTAGGMITILPGSYDENITLTNGNILNGSFTTTGLLSIAAGATLSPGNSPGLITVNGLTLSSGAIFAAELDGTTAGSGYDQVAVNGSVDITNAQLDLSLNFLPQTGDSFTLIDNDQSDAITGTFAGLAEGDTLIVTDSVSGEDVTLQITYTGGDGNDVVLSVYDEQQIAEPPVALDINLTATEDGSAVTQSFTTTGGEGALRFVIVEQPTMGNLINHGDGTFTFTPGDFPNLNTGQTQNVTFTYKAIDSANQESDTRTVTVTINGVTETTNTPNGYPNAAVDNAFIDSDEPTDINVIANDSDPDGDTLHVHSVDLVSHLGVPITLNSDGTIHYDPSGNFSGYNIGEMVLDWFRYETQDPYGNSDQTRVNVWVTVVEEVEVVNNAPLAQNVTGDAAEDGAPVTLSFQADDADGDDTPATLTYTLVGSPSEGSVINNQDGTFTFDPGNDFQDLNDGQSRDVTFSYYATDSHGADSNVATVTITVDGVDELEPEDNVAPIAENVLEETDEYIRVKTYSFDADDANTFDNPGNLTYTILSQPSHGTLTNNDNGTFTFDFTDYPNLVLGENRIITFTYKATDAQGADSNTATVTMIINGIDDVPVANNVSKQTDQNTVVNGSFDGTDADLLDTIDYVIIDSPTQGTVINNNDGTFSFDPNGDFDDLAEGQTRDVTFTYKAFDSHNAYSNLATVTITVIGTNETPTAGNVSQTTDKNTPVIVSADGNDIDTADTLTYTIVDSPTQGSVTNNNDSTFTFNPGSDFDDLGDNETRDVTFTYKVSDNHSGESNTATVTITVNGTQANQAPVAQNVNANVPEDGPYATVIFNADDADSDDTPATLTYQIITSPTLGILTNNNDGTFSYDPHGDFESLTLGQSQDVTFTYQAIDSHGEVSNTATVTLTIDGADDTPPSNNQYPNAAVDSFSTDSNTSINLTVLDNDSDSDGDTLRVDSLETLTSERGVPLTINADGTIAYDPSGHFNDLEIGEIYRDTFRYVVSDEHGLIDATRVFVYVTRVADGSPNESPTAGSVLGSLSEDDAPVTLAFNGSDTDDALASLTYHITSNPTKGSVLNNGDGTFTFSPGTDFQALNTGESETVSFTYQVTDPHGATSNLATVTITIHGEDDIVIVNTDPVAQNVSGYTNEDAASVTLNFNADDADADDTPGSQVYTLLSSPAQGTVVNNNDGTFTFTPGSDFQDLNDGESRDITFTYKATDSHGADSNTATISITVKGSTDDAGSNKAPVAQNVSGNAVEDGGNVTFSFNADDADGDDTPATLTYTLLSTPSQGTVINNNDGTFTFIPGNDFQDLSGHEYGMVRFTYQATDSHGATSLVASISISIQGQNDYPNGAPNLTSTTQNAAIDIDVLSNDFDVDGDTLDVSEVDLVSEMGVPLTVNPDGTIHYDPTGYFDHLATGTTVRDSFRYNLTDPYGSQDRTRVFVDVTAITATTASIPGSSLITISQAPIHLANHIEQIIQNSNRINQAAMAFSNQSASLKPITPVSRLNNHINLDQGDDDNESGNALKLILVNEDVAME